MNDDATIVATSSELHQSDTPVKSISNKSTPDYALYFDEPAGDQRFEYHYGYHDGYIDGYDQGYNARYDNLLVWNDIGDDGDDYDEETMDDEEEYFEEDNGDDVEDMHPLEDADYEDDEVDAESDTDSSSSEHTPAQKRQRSDDIESLEGLEDQLLLVTWDDTLLMIDPNAEVDGHVANRRIFVSRILVSQAVIDERDMVEKGWFCNLEVLPPNLVPRLFVFTTDVVGYSIIVSSDRIKSIQNGNAIPSNLLHRQQHLRPNPRIQLPLHLHHRNINPPRALPPTKPPLSMEPIPRYDNSSHILHIHPCPSRRGCGTRDATESGGGGGYVGGMDDEDEEEC